MSYSFTEPKKNLKHYHKVRSDFFDSIFQPVDPKTIVTRKHRKIFRFSFLTIDIAAINIIHFLLIAFSHGNNKMPYMVFLLVTNFFWIISAYSTALYFGNERFFKRTLRSFLVYFALTLFFIFLYKFSYSRLFVLLSFSGFMISLAVSRSFLIGTKHLLQKKTPPRKIIFLGCSELSERVATTFSIYDNNLDIHGFFGDINEYKKTSAYPVIGGINDSILYALKNNISEIYSTVSPESNTDIYDIAQQAEKNFIRFKYVPDFRIFINRNVHIGFEKDIPVLSLRPEPLQEVENRFKKRTLDIIFSSAVILLILSWLVPLVAILIKLESRGPVFFKQLRTGKNNLPFLCFKFRSLKVNRDSDNIQVTRKDNRFTRLGKFLRKTNLDELPQFYNVLQGHMSIVGPRPHMLKHTEEYSKIYSQYMLRHFLKPGVTGWAQINGYRGEIKKEEQLFKRVEHDIAYMENWSMWFDFKIIFLTFFKTIRGDKNAF